MCLTAFNYQPKWKKILYAPQPYEDNYVDETFLEQMRTNGALATVSLALDRGLLSLVARRVGLTTQLCCASAANVQDHDYGGMVRSAAAITQQICAVLIFFVRFESSVCA